MSSDGLADRPLVLSAFDLPDAAALMVHSCETVPARSAQRVAAGADSGGRGAMADESTWMRGQEITEMRLDPRHWLLFNPVGNGGVVVLNEPALSIFAGFRHPVTIAAARTAAGQDAAAFAGVCNRLAALA